MRLPVRYFDKTQTGVLIARSTRGSALMGPGPIKRRGGGLSSRSAATLVSAGQSRVLSSGQVMTGAVVSTTVTVWLHWAVLPQASLAVKEAEGKGLRESLSAKEAEAGRALPCNLAKYATEVTQVLKADFQIDLGH